MRQPIATVCLPRHRVVIGYVEFADAIRRHFRTESGQKLFHHMPMHIGQAEISSCAAEGEFLVIETEEPENGGVEVVDVDFVFDSLKSKFIGRAMNVTTLNSAARHPHGEAMMIVVAAVDFAGIGTWRRQLDCGGAAK